MNFQSARQKMVDNQIRPCDVSDQALLEAFLLTPREEFFPKDQRDLAYIDKNCELSGSSGLSRYMLNPPMLGKLCQLAQIKSWHTVLLIGAGTGYTAALFSQLAAHVVALEADEKLAKTAKSNLARLGCNNVNVLFQDFASGWEQEAPYDVIFSESSITKIPEIWTAQLADGGRMIVVVGAGSSARATIVCNHANEIGVVAEFNCNAPVLPGFESSVEFVF